MSSKRKCGSFPLVLLLKDMTDGAVDARPDFIFIKEHMRPTLLLFPKTVPAHVFHRRTLPLATFGDRLSLWSPPHLPELFATARSRYTKRLQCIADNLGFDLFSHLRCFHLPLLSVLCLLLLLSLNVFSDKTANRRTAEVTVC